MSFHQGCGFRACGAVVRKSVVPSGKCAFLTLEVPGERRTQKIEFKAFSDEMIEEIGCLGVGQIVEVTGGIDVGALRGKDRQDVLVDGRPKWVPSLVVKTIKIEGSSVAPSRTDRKPDAPPTQPSKPAAGWNDDGDVPF